MTLFELRDAVLEGHSRMLTLGVAQDWCGICDAAWPCKPYRLAIALSPENVAVGLARVESQAPDDASESERAEWRDKATDLLRAIPVDTQEDSALERDISEQVGQRVVRFQR